MVEVRFAVLGVSKQEGIKLLRGKRISNIFRFGDRRTLKPGSKFI